MGAEEFNERLISLAERKQRIRHEGQLQRMDATCAGTAGLSEVFRCSQSGCGWSFASRRGLSQHLRLAHGNAVVSMVTCPKCGKSSSASGISRHKCSGKQEVVSSLEFNSSPDPGGDYHHHHHHHHHVCMYVCMYVFVCIGDNQTYRQI